MNANIAVGLIESSSIAKGIEASDAMCKMAQVELVILRPRLVEPYAESVGKTLDEIRRVLALGA